MEKSKGKLLSLFELKNMNSETLQLVSLLAIFREFAADGLIKIDGYKLKEANDKEPLGTQRKQMLTCLTAGIAKQPKKTTSEKLSDLVSEIHSTIQPEKVCTVAANGDIFFYEDCPENKLEYVLTLVNQLPIDDIIYGFRTAHSEYFFD